MRGLLLPLFALLAAGCGASEPPHQSAREAQVALPASADATASVAPAASAAPAPTASSSAVASALPPWPLDPKAPSAARKRMGVYWNAAAKEEEDRRGSYAALAIDEDGVMWLFARRDRKIHGFVVRHDGGTERASLEVVYPAQLPEKLAASRWSLEGATLVETTPEGVTRRTRDDHAALAPPASTAPWVELETGGAQLTMLGPLYLGRGMGRAGDDCWMGIVMPYPPWEKSQYRGERKLGIHVIGDSMTYGAGRASGCVMRALPRDGLVKVEGNITDGYLVADASGPAAFLAIGYMSAAAFVPSDRRGDPALRKLLESAVGTAAE
jgi:hypothetical protein